MCYLRYLCFLASNTYWVVFLFCFSSSCVLYVSLDCQFLIAPSVFSNVYYVSFSRSGFLYNILSCKTVAGVVPIDGTVPTPVKRIALHDRHLLELR